MRIINLKKRIGNFQMKIPELQIEEGKIHGFIGGNGSGKTTAAKLIMGILQPDTGYIDYNGLTMREITMTSQRPYLMHSSVYDNLIYPCRLRRKKTDQNRVDEMLSQFGLLDKKKQYARSLSSGEQQKLSMLRAMIFEPKLLIVDETFSNMDPESVEQFEELILEKQKTQPVTWIIISHRLSHICRLCDRLHFFAQGQVIASGTKEEVLFENEDERVQKFVTKETISRRDR